LKFEILNGYYGSIFGGREIGKEKATKYESTPKRCDRVIKAGQDFPFTRLYQ
jgi:hypothetical protein